MKDMFRALWAYRYFVLSSIRNDFRLKFIQSKLGTLWMVIHPLMQVLIFALILSEVLSARLPGIDNKYAYALYLMAGMLFWMLFSETVNKCMLLFVENANLIKKVAFPRICLPFIAAGSVLVNYVLLMVAIFVVFAVLGHFPGIQACWLPVLTVVTLGFAMAIGLLLGVLNVFMRDISQIVPVILQALFWLTPIVYRIDILPEHVARVFKHNPLYPLAASYQNVLLFDHPPVWSGVLPLVLVTFVLGFVSLLVFRRASPEMVDAL